MIGYGEKSVYKAGQGMPSRIGAMVVGFLIALYASYSWFRWQPIGIQWPSAASVDPIFAGALLVAVCGLFGWLVFRSPKSADYLIDMDDELRKVVWPKAMPLFDPKTEAWGSTYVVIVCAILFTIFIWVVDILLKLIVTDGLFQRVLFAS